MFDLWVAERSNIQNCTHAPLDLAILHFVTRPCSISSGIVRNADVPSFLPIAKLAFGFGGAYLDRSPRSVAIRPYFSIYDPDVVRGTVNENSFNFKVLRAIWIPMSDSPIRWPSPDERSPLAVNAMFQSCHDGGQTRRRKHCEYYSPNSPIRPFYERKRI